MLKKFEVDNFKGFSKRLVFDLTARDYEFNQNLTENGIVKKAIIYGKNGVGKSTLGIALFDIISHLTDKERVPFLYLQNYICLENIMKPALFKYTFNFDNDIVVYEYKKWDPDNLVSEKLTVNDKTLIDYYYGNEASYNNFIDDSIKGSLNIKLVDNKLSVIKYIYRNTPTDNDSIITKLVCFCENMLWYRRLSEGSSYAGFSNGNNSFFDFIYERGKTHELQEFLKRNSVDYQLEFEAVNGKRELIAYFNNGTAKTLFSTVASTGTMALAQYFAWKSIAFDKISFLFIDEFDAFLHFESAKFIVEELNKQKNFQSIVTTHNTYLMQNKLTRPDCCYLMTKNKIASLFNSTDKEIREAHNLEKMYVNGAFIDE